MTDSLLRLNVHEVIVIQSNKEFHNLKSADNLFTFICWEQNEKYFVCIVSRDKVYSTVEFNGNQIFNFSNKKETFVTKNEQTLKFTPPLTNQNVVFYISKSLQGYFEQPDNMNNNPTTYYPTDKTKESLRAEWFSAIYKALNNEDFSLKAKSVYDRDKELELK